MYFFSFKEERELINAIGIDVSDEALKVAKYNAEKLNLDVQFLKDDITKPNKTYPKSDYIIDNHLIYLQSELNSMSPIVRNPEPYCSICRR